MKKYFCFASILTLLLGCQMPSESDSYSSPSDPMSVIGKYDDSVETETFYKELENSGADTERFRNEANAVGKITIPGSGSATGFLVAPDIVMTNSHVVQSKKEYDPTNSIDYYDPERVNGMTFDNGFTRTGSSSPVEVKEVIMSNQQNDVAFIRLKQPISDVKPLQLEQNPTTGSQIYTIGHPGGEYKQFSAWQTNDSGRIVAPSTTSSTSEWEVDPNAGSDPYYDSKYKNAIIHTADTRGGSSGSPLIDAKTGRVVGLHFTGYQSGLAPYKGEYNAAIPTNRIRSIVNENQSQLPPDLLSIFQ